MLSAKEVTIIYETLLSSPGMNDAVKIDLRIPRKMILLLSKVIESGLILKDDAEQNGLLGIMDKETTEQLKSISGEILRKGGLTEMNDRLNSLNTR